MTYVFVKVRLVLNGQNIGTSGAKFQFWEAFLWLLSFSAKKKVTPAEGERERKFEKRPMTQTFS